MKNVLRVKALQAAVHNVLTRIVPDIDSDMTDFIADCLWDEFNSANASNNAFDKDPDFELNRLSESIHSDLVDNGLSASLDSTVTLVSQILIEWRQPPNHEAPVSEPILFTPEEAETNQDDFDEYLPPGSCEICYRSSKKLGFHHLIPKMTHKRVIAKGLFSKEDCRTRGLRLCGTCHRMLHKTFSHMELALQLNTLELIMENEVMVRYQAWAAKQKRKNNKTMIIKCVSLSELMISRLFCQSATPIHRIRLFFIQ